MTITINDLPPELFAHTLNYLNLPGFLKAVQVCTKWHSFQKIDLIWQKYCREMLESTTPFNNSWRSRYIVFCNLIQKKFDISASRLISASEAKNFGNTPSNPLQPIIIGYIDNRSPVKYIARNLSTNEIVVMAPDDNNLSPIIASEICEDKWFALNRDGRILICDLRTGALETQIQTKNNIRFREDPKLKVNPREIIIYGEKFIKIVKITQEGHEETDYFTNAEIDVVVNTSQSSIFCVIFENFPFVNSFICIDKMTKKETNLSPSIAAMDVSPDGKHIVAYNMNGFCDVCLDSEFSSAIYKFQHCKFTLSSDFNAIRQCLDLRHATRIKFFKEWVALSGFGKFTIINLKNGKMICSIDLKLEDFCFNDCCIIGETNAGFPAYHLNYQYVLFDFSKLTPSSDKELFKEIENCSLI